MNNPQVQALMNAIAHHHRTIIPAVAATVIGGIAIFLYHRKQHPIGWGDDCNEIKESNKSCILEIPPEARKHIWIKLNYNDVLKLRQVCQVFKQDVDEFVGVDAIINSTDERSFQFYQNVALRRLFVTDLSSSIGSDFLAEPSQLRELTIAELSPISISNIRNLLRNCCNIKKLVLQLNFSHNKGAHGTTAASKIVLQSIQEKLKLTHLELVKVSSYFHVEKVYTNATDVSFSVPLNLTHFQVEIPDVDQEHLPSWKYLLDHQTNLRTLIADFGSIHWEFHSKAIIRNKLSLYEISLKNILSRVPETNQQKPFDWNIFRDCEKLRILTIISSKTINVNGSEEYLTCINFDEFSGEQLERLYISRIKLSREAVIKIYRQMPSLISGLLENIGIEGEDTVHQLVWEDHENRLIAQITRVREQQRQLDIVVHCLVAVSMVMIILYFGTSHYFHLHYLFY